VATYADKPDVTRRVRAHITYHARYALKLD